jgi:hypothetical protein|tara:strand:- start:76 stop:276 length:201 start_codon:yes stop_codon:yes gene_type:complete
MMSRGDNMLDKEKYNDYTLGIKRSSSSREAENPRGRTKFNGYFVDKTKQAGLVYVWVNGKKFVSHS